MGARSMGATPQKAISIPYPLRIYFKGKKMFQGLRVGVIIPARDEAPAITQVVAGLIALHDVAGLSVIDTIVVCDNGSTDGTSALASRAGAQVVSEPLPGYGRACLRAMDVLQQQSPPVDVLLFVDGDRSVLPEQCLRLLTAIAQGADLALGARNLGRAEPGALTPPQIFGNAFAVFLVRLIWRARFSDLGPFRAIRMDAYRRLNMLDLSFGWTIEMQIKALQHGLRWIEVPVDTRVRLGKSKISGTVKGVIGAGIGILGMVVRLWWRERNCAKTALSNPA
jgi:glycosyltransferase involved in cell wall biosynthesis